MSRQKWDYCEGEKKEVRGAGWVPLDSRWAAMVRKCMYARQAPGTKPRSMGKQKIIRDVFNSIFRMF